MTDQPKDAPQNPNPDYQDRDILIKPVLIFLAGLTVVTVLTLIGMSAFFRVMERQTERAEAHIPPEARDRVLPPEPRLIVDERMNLDEYLANARAILDNYAMLDENKGTVRIPVDHAIELVAVRGLPRWEQPEPPVEPEAEIDEDPDAMLLPDTPDDIPETTEVDEQDIVE